MRAVPGFVAVQCAGAVTGVALADLMFDLPAFSWSVHARGGLGQFLSEVIATFGLLFAIRGVVANRPTAVPFAVGAYITAAYWFTSSTSFANPAVTLARALTNTFAGIRLSDVPLFVTAQLVGAGLATIFAAWLMPAAATSARGATSGVERGVR